MPAIIPLGVLGGAGEVDEVMGGQDAYLAQQEDRPNDYVSLDLQPVSPYISTIHGAEVAPGPGLTLQSGPRSWLGARPYPTGCPRRNVIIPKYA